MIKTKQIQAIDKIINAIDEYINNFPVDNNAYRRIDSAKTLILGIKNELQEPKTIELIEPIAGRKIAITLTEEFKTLIESGIFDEVIEVECNQ